MKRCNYAEISDSYGHPGLEDVGLGSYKLKEKEGTITFCESQVISGSPELIIEFSGLKKSEKIRFPLKALPIPAVAGQILRVFYEKDENGIEVQAFELFDGSRISRRGGLEHIKFVD